MYKKARDFADNYVRDHRGATREEAIAEMQEMGMFHEFISRMLNILPSEYEVYEPDAYRMSPSLSGFPYTRRLVAYRLDFP
eukprot:394869-Prorocentrum_minimum.AAC.4